jgi:uncharacterized protein (TIGR00369 family)
MPSLFDVGQAVLAKQPFSRFLGTELLLLESGKAVLALNIRPEFLQQNGFVHGGVTSYLIDNALTFAGGSVLGERVVTAEYKVTYLRAARGERLIAEAVVESSSPRSATCTCEVRALHGGTPSRCAVGEGTISLI